MKHFDSFNLFLLYKDSLIYYPDIEEKLKQRSALYLASICKTAPHITRVIVSYIQPAYLTYLFKQNTIPFYTSILFNDIKRLNLIFKNTFNHKLSNKEKGRFYIIKTEYAKQHTHFPEKFDLTKSILLYQRIGYTLQTYIRDLSWEHRRNTPSRYDELFPLLKTHFYVYYLWIDNIDMYYLIDNLIQMNYHLKK